MGIGFCPGGGSSGPGCNNFLASAAGWPLGCACVGSSGSATFDEDDFSFLSFFFFLFPTRPSFLRVQVGQPQLHYIQFKKQI